MCSCVLFYRGIGHLSGILDYGRDLVSLSLLFSPNCISNLERKREEENFGRKREIEDLELVLAFFFIKSDIPSLRQVFYLLLLDLS